MLAPSSPITFPASSSPVNSKRRRPSDAPKPPKSRARGGFIADDDSDNDDITQQPSPKRRMLQQDGLERAEKDVNESLPSAQELITTPPDSQPRDESDDEAERYERLFGVQTSPNDDLNPAPYRISTCSGKSVPIRERKAAARISYATMVAARSRTREGRASRAYYGVAIHELIDDATKQIAQERAQSATAPVTPPANNNHPDKPVRSVEDGHTHSKKSKRTMLWTEKYRARTFMDLVGDDLTNRQVLRWLKRWDPIVFPHHHGAHKPKHAAGRAAHGQYQPGHHHHQQQQQQQQTADEEQPHRKILMLHGPPGLGKTTLAHVCARQAGYEVLEINASDERSRDVVRGRIRTSLGTESVKTVENKKPGSAQRPHKVARPVCVVVDEVDGVVGGAAGGSGEGGFVKALIDLVLLDQKNSAAPSSGAGRRKKKGDDFKQMRPLILICNDVYHPSLRPLRQSGLAEVIHVGKPSVEAVVTRLKSIFEKEGIPCEKDAARKLCEAAWGMTSGIDAKRGAESNAEGDLRGVMVVGEWVAGRLRATSSRDGSKPCLTRQWIDRHIIHDLAHGGGGARGLGRGGVKEIVSRVFQDGAGFPKPATPTAQPDKNTRHEQPQAQLGFSEQQKKYAMARLGEMIDASGDVDRIVTDIFLEYPNRDFNDDSFLSKPDHAYEWLHFHDACSARLFASHEWELAPYASQPVLACHHLFASPHRQYHHHHHYHHQPPQQFGDEAHNNNTQQPPPPFSGPRADYAAHEAAKATRAALQALHAQLPPGLARAFRGPEDVAAGFVPYLARLVSPDVRPVVVVGGGGGGGGGAAVASVRREAEKAMVRRAALVLAEVGVALLRGRVEGAESRGQQQQWVYRMEPDLDALTTFETAGAHVLAAQPPTRYAVRQVLDQELHKTLAAREGAARQARLRGSSSNASSAPAGAAPRMGWFGGGEDDDGGNADKENLAVAALGKAGSGVKRDFFGRVIVGGQGPLGEVDGNVAAAAAAAGGSAGKRKKGKGEMAEGAKVWVTYHEGLNNAVRKPISLDEFLRGF